MFGPIVHLKEKIAERVIGWEGRKLTLVFEWTKWTKKKSRQKLSDPQHSIYLPKNMWQKKLGLTFLTTKTNILNPLKLKIKESFWDLLGNNQHSQSGSNLVEQG